MIISSSKRNFTAVFSLVIMPAGESSAAGHLPLRQATLTFYLSEGMKLLFRKRHRNYI